MTARQFPFRHTDPTRRPQPERTTTMMSKRTVTHRKSGGSYSIDSVALDTQSHKIVVVYRHIDEESHQVFTRPIEDFFGVEPEPGPDGRHPFRFIGAIELLNDAIAATDRPTPDPTEGE